MQGFRYLELGLAWLLLLFFKRSGSFFLELFVIFVYKIIFLVWQRGVITILLNWDLMFRGFFKDEYKATVYINLDNDYRPFPLDETFLEELAIVDVNGDGLSDLIGFRKERDFYCRLGTENNGSFLPCEEAFRFCSF